MRYLFLLASLLFLSVANAQVTPERAATSRRVAAESAVLLKNDGVLPLPAGASVRYVPPVDHEFIGCGKGSAWVHMPYLIGIDEGLRRAGFQLTDTAKVAVLPIVRDATESHDAENPEVYYLSAAEREQLQKLKRSGVERIVVVLNVGTTISLSELKADQQVAAILYVAFPGMEGGNAVAELLSGKVNPSGRLNVTLAARLEDYPSDASWQRSRMYVPYEEDIFLGYRYFATIPGAAAKVVYPFGHGLAYTTFAHAAAKLTRQGDRLTVTVRVTNTGRRAGRESVLLYTGVEGGQAEHPARELRAFAKTKLLAPGASETLTLSFSRQALAYFDDEGVSGRPGSWVIDGGKYSVYVGGAVDQAVKVAEFEESAEILSTPGFKLDPARLGKRLRANGNYSEVPVLHGADDGSQAPVAWPEPPAEKIRFDEVVSGRRTLDEFIAQLPLTAIVELLQGQPNILPVGNTRSIGTLKEYGVPGLQTADGPVGIRLGSHPRAGEAAKPEQQTTAFPATVLAACSFDVELMEQFGRILGEEAAVEKIDIHLAPGVNLSRHPLAGRNFEYFGEDPLLAGKMAAAYIRGVQSCGVASTIKHFAANNRENTRKEASSVVSERAMRELYLKPFELAVKEAAPHCVMTSYNRLNGEFTGASYGLIEGILRGEWGFDGVVMTDWDARTRMWQNVAAGNDVKMPLNLPLGYGFNVVMGNSVTPLPENAGVLISNASFIDSARRGLISPECIRTSVRRVLELVLKLKRGKAE